MTPVHYWTHSSCLIVHPHGEQSHSLLWRKPQFTNHTICEGESGHLLIPRPAVPASQSQCMWLRGVVREQSSRLVPVCNPPDSTVEPCFPDMALM